MILSNIEFVMKHSAATSWTLLIRLVQIKLFAEMMRVCQGAGFQNLFKNHDINRLCHFFYWQVVLECFFSTPFLMPIQNYIRKCAQIKELKKTNQLQNYVESQVCGSLFGILGFWAKPHRALLVTHWGIWRTLPYPVQVNNEPVRAYKLTATMLIVSYLRLFR